MTVKEPRAIMSGGPTHVAISPTRAAGIPAMITVGQHGGKIGPPTCGAFHPAARILPRYRAPGSHLRAGSQNTQLAACTLGHSPPGLTPLRGGRYGCVPGQSRGRSGVPSMRGWDHPTAGFCRIPAPREPWAAPWKIRPGSRSYTVNPVAACAIRLPMGCSSGQLR